MALQGLGWYIYDYDDKGKHRRDKFEERPGNLAAAEKELKKILKDIKNNVRGAHGK